MLELKWLLVKDNEGLASKEVLLCSIRGPKMKHLTTIDSFSELEASETILQKASIDVFTAIMLAPIIEDQQAWLKAFWIDFWHTLQSWDDASEDASYLKANVEAFNITLAEALAEYA